MYGHNSEKVKYIRPHHIFTQESYGFEPMNFDFAFPLIFLSNILVIKFSGAYEFCASKYMLCNLYILMVRMKFSVDI